MLGGGRMVIKTGERSFFHCDKADGGCGHISHTANVPDGLNARPGPITADAAAWIATACESCGKVVQAT